MKNSVLTPTKPAKRPKSPLALELQSVSDDLLELTASQHIQIKADQAEVTKQLESTIFLARETAQSIREVYGDYSYTIGPLLRDDKENPWGCPSKGRSAACFYSLDEALKVWKGSQKLLDQLEDVPNQVKSIAAMAPQRRQAPIKELVNLVKNLASVPDILLTRTIPSILQHSRDVNKHLRSN